ncbi:retrovirus-related pol polyprotein from transposon TNT 1-94 [Tanacetum coccineum]
MFEVKMNQVLNENERLLEQVINKDTVNIIMNSSVDNASVNVHECEKCLKLETELLNKKDFIEKRLTINWQLVETSSSNLVSNKPALSSTGVRPSTSASGSQHSGNTKNDKIQRPSSSTLKNKVEAHPRTIKSSLKNKNSVVEPKGTANVQHSKLNANFELLCVKCNGCMLSDNHDLCVLDFINDVNARAKSKFTFTIVGNACPLTRITTTAEVPLRKPTALESDTPKPVVILVYSRKPKKSKTNVPGRLNCSLEYGDYQIGNVTISRVYYMEGLGHKLFFVVQLCDLNLEVAFRQHACFIRNLEGVDLLTGSRGNNLYTLSLGDMMASSPICLLSKASKTKSWLWHRRLSHLNFGAINHLARHDLVQSLPKLKFKKDHMCSACAMGKSKKKSHKPKSEDTNQEKLYLLHMDLCGPMRVANVNGKKYILVIVNDYSRFTWVKCLRSKDEAPNFIIKFLKMIQDFLYSVEYYEKVGISHETFVARSPQQNGIVERCNLTLIKAARTMLIYAKALLFLWVEAVATACYTQNHSITRLRHGKTLYELLHDKLPNLSFFHVFGALCYSKNDSKNLGKLQPKADIDFDELTAMASEHSSLGPTLHEITPVTISSGLIVNRPAPEVIDLIAKVVAPEPEASTGSPSSTTVDQDAPSPSNSQTSPETQSLVIPNDVEEDNHDLDVAHMNNDPLFGIPIPKNVSEASSSSDVIPTIVHTAASKLEHVTKWTKDHLLDNIISELERLVSTRLQLYEQALFCYYDAFLTSVEPKNYKDALTQALARLDAIRIFLAYDAHMNMIVYQMDVKTAFLNEILLLARGLQISQSPRGIFINQSKYALESLKKYGMESSDPVDSPMVEKSKLDVDIQRKVVDLTHYCGMIGTLMYLTASRPDLTFAYPKDSSIALTAYADADHAGCQDTRRKQVENRVVELYFINTEYQLAGIFTKALGRERIEFLINKLGMRSFTQETLKKLADEAEE